MDFVQGDEGFVAAGGAVREEVATNGVVLNDDVAETSAGDGLDGGFVLLDVYDGEEAG